MLMHMGPPWDCHLRSSDHKTLVCKHSWCQGCEDVNGKRRKITYVLRGLEERGVGNDCSVCVGLPSGVMKLFQHSMMRTAAHTVGALNPLDCTLEND